MEKLPTWRPSPLWRIRGESSRRAASRRSRTATNSGSWPHRMTRPRPVFARAACKMIVLVSWS